MTKERAQDPGGLSRLEGFLLELVGMQFKEAAWAYPDELCVDLTHRDKSSNRDRVPKKWTVATRLSPWLLLSDSAVVARDRDNKEAVLQSFQPLVGATVTAAEVRDTNDRSLSLAFDNGYRFVILTRRLRRGKPDPVRLWGLYAPDYLAVIVETNGSISVDAT